MRILIVFWMLILLLPSIAVATPQLVSVHGKMTDIFGNNVTGPYDMAFRLYAQETGGTAIWSENWNTTTSKVTFGSDGYFSVLIGSHNSLDLPFDTQYWLEIQVQSDNLTPRFKLGSVPYTFRSNITENLAAGAKAAGNLNMNGFDITTAGGIYGTTLYEGGVPLSSTYLSASDFGTGFLGWKNLTDYPVACPEDQFITTLGDTITCAEPSLAGVGGWTDDGTIVRLTTSTDNVGVGILNPQAKLHIAGGSLLVNNSISTGSPNLGIFRNDASGGNTLFLGVGATGTVLGADRIGLGDTTGYRLVWDTTSGNVGIGTSDPQSKLEVNGTLNATDIVLRTNCDDGQVLKWVGGVGTCGTDIGGEAEGDNLQTITGRGNTTTHNLTIGATVLAQTMLDVVGDANVTGTIYQSGNTVLDASTPFAGDVSGTYGSIDIGSGVIGSTELAAGAVTNIKVATNTINTTQIIDGTITSSDLAGDLALGWQNLTDYPNTCGAGKAIQAIGDTLTCVDVSSGDEVTGAGTAGYIAQWNSTTTINSSIIYQDGINIGIGTTDPQKKLDVVGDSNATGYVYGMTGICIGTDCKTAWSQITDMMPWSNSSSQVFLKDGYPLFVNASNTLFVDGTSGRVGVGTESPQYELDVNGFINTKSIHGVSGEGLVLAMSFNGETVTGSAGSETILDSSGYNNHGTNNGTTFNSSGGFNGGGALEFDGTDDYVNCGNDDTLDFGTGDATVSAWIKHNGQYVSDGTIASKTSWSGINDGWQVGISTDGKFFAHISDGIKNIGTYASGTSIDDDSWHHVVAVFDRDGDLTRYVDGRIEPNPRPLSTVSQEQNNTRNFRIGARDYSSLWAWNGTIDEVRIYNRALSADEIKANYLQRKEYYNSYVSQKDVYVDVSGNVGIGTADPQKKLDVVGDINATSGIYGANIYQGGNAVLDTATSPGGNISGTYGDLQLVAGSVGSAQLISTAVSAGDYGGSTVIPAYTVDADGRIIAATNLTIRSASIFVTGIVQLDNTVSSTSNTTASTANATKTAYDTATAKASPGTCPTGQAVQNTTTGGVECIAVSTGGEVEGTGTPGYLAQWNTSSTLNTSVIYQSGTYIGIGTTDPNSTLHVAGDISVTSGNDICIDGGNCLSSFGSVFYNKTAATYTASFSFGGFIGYKAGDAICNASFEDTHLCSMAEISYTIATRNLSELTGWTGEAWIATGPAKYSPASLPVNDCNGFTHGVAGSYLGNWWTFNQSTGGTGKTGNCGNTLSVGCCR